MSKTLEAQFNDYASFHKTAGNEVCHFIGIPLIVFSLFALLAQWTLLQSGSVTLLVSDLVLLLALVYYATLDVPLALLMLLAAGLMDVLGRFVPWRVALGLFVLGWIFQGVGHYRYEKKSPAFTRNFVHLLVGPLWILARAVGRA
jgi:uncharacterized membrane protein YGL010W